MTQTRTDVDHGPSLHAHDVPLRPHARPNILYHVRCHNPPALHHAPRLWHALWLEGRLRRQRGALRPRTASWSKGEAASWAGEREGSPCQRSIPASPGALWGGSRTRPRSCLARRCGCPTTLPGPATQPTSHTPTAMYPGNLLQDLSSCLLEGTGGWSIMASSTGSFHACTPSTRIT